MRTEIFHETLCVALSEEDRQLRARQGARIAVALKAQRAKAEAETEAWAARRKELRAEEEHLIVQLYTVSEAAETGYEDRPVRCSEVIVGVMVNTMRLDTHELVAARPAYADEVSEHHGPIVVPGGGAAKTKTKRVEVRADDVDDFLPDADDVPPH